MEQEIDECDICGNSGVILSNAEGTVYCACPYGEVQKETDSAVAT